MNADFFLKFTNLAIMRYLIETNPSTNPKKNKFNREILTVLNEFEQMKETNKENDEKER